MVFCNTRRNVDKLAYNLKEQGIHCMAIHGGLSQNRRSDTLKAFHERDTLVLICTDIAARGLDIKDVSHIYNYDIPKTGEEYIHRIGRTARAGKNGIAISFVSSGDHTEFRQIIRKVGSNIEKQTIPEFEKLPSQNKFGIDKGHNITHGNRENRFMGHRGSRGNFSRNQNDRKKDNRNSNNKRRPNQFSRR